MVVSRIAYPAGSGTIVEWDSDEDSDEESVSIGPGSDNAILHPHSSAISSIEANNASPRHRKEVHSAPTSEHSSKHPSEEGINRLEVFEWLAKCDI
jgi:hypothetical protein